MTAVFWRHHGTLKGDAGLPMQEGVRRAGGSSPLSPTEILGCKNGENGPVVNLTKKTDKLA